MSSGVRRYFAETPPAFVGIMDIETDCATQLEELGRSVFMFLFLRHAPRERLDFTFRPGESDGPPPGEFPHAPGVPAQTLKMRREPGRDWKVSTNFLTQSKPLPDGVWAYRDTAQFIAHDGIDGTRPAIIYSLERNLVVAGEHEMPDISALPHTLDWSQEEVLDTLCFSISAVADSIKRGTCDLYVE